jgi:hypothetical protein
MPRHPPIALKTLDRSHCQYPLRDLEEIVARTKSRAGFASMELAQKDQLLEIGSRARLGLPTICERLSVFRGKSRTLRLMKFEQIFSLRCQTEQAQSLKLGANSFSNDSSATISTRHQAMVEPDGIEPTTSCLQSRRSPS